MPNKTCKRCHRTLPEAEFNRRGASPDGLHTHCRICEREEARDYHHRWRETHPCMERTRRSDEKTNAVARAKYAENPEENRAKRAAWREAHREECREYNRKWTEANREQVRLAQHVYLERYPERARQTRKTWRENNPEWFRANGQMRRCRDSESHFTGPDILEQIARQRKRCFYCGEKLGPGYHVDHITPVSKGGSNGLENIAIACAPCNRRKLAKWPWEFARYDGQAVML